MPDKIHCDLLEIFGPDWAIIEPEKIQCLITSIHTMDELFGQEPELYGFVGTERIDSVVGGYFAIQYEEEEFHYDKQKRLDIRYNAPFARIFFVLFGSTGKLLLQNTKFVGTNLTMHKAARLFQDALDRVLLGCQIHQSLSLSLAPELSSEQDFIKEFDRSTRVVKLEVTDPSPDKIPNDFEYYNPQRDRNSIIRDSHRNDYSHLKKVDLEAKSDGNLKKTHLRDLILAANPQVMKYYVETEEYIIRREAPTKFEFYVDMKAEKFAKDQLSEIIERLRRERAIFLNTPTSKRPQSDRQMSLFDIIPEES